jgi:hypothetical protein
MTAAHKSVEMAVRAVVAEPMHPLARRADLQHLVKVMQAAQA